MEDRIEKLDKNLQAAGVVGEDGLVWLDAHDPRLTLRGLAWPAEDGGKYARLPLRAKDIVRPPVWGLAQCPAGVNVAFKTDSPTLAVRVRNEGIGRMTHMAETGIRGACLLGGAPGRRKAWATAVPPIDGKEFAPTFFKGLDRRMREFAIYLPLYNGLASMEVGFCPDAALAPPSPPALPKPVVFYGTSITQGGCASAPGHDFVSALGMKLNLHTINLGFSGNGLGESEVARLVAEIDAAMFVLDYAANASVDSLTRTLPEFYGILRAAHPTTPILLVSRVCYWRMGWNPEQLTFHEDLRDAAIHFYSCARQRGDRNLHFVDGQSLITPGDHGAQVDGVHPTDHGFALMAERLAPAIERLLLAELNG